VGTVVTFAQQGGRTLPASPTPSVLISAAIPANLPQLDSSVVEKFHPNTFLLTNKSDKAIVGLVVRWTFTDAQGFSRVSDIHQDSFARANSPVLLAPQSTLIVAPNTLLPVAYANKLPRVGPTLSDLYAGAVRSVDMVGASAITATIDLIIWQDGELVGPNQASFDVEIQNRKIAASQLAKQIRNAINNGDDPKAVLRQVLASPTTQSDTLALNAHIYAQMLISARDMGKAAQSLEALPEPPTFFRKD
jgi:hypothetical protein